MSEEENRSPEGSPHRQYLDRAKSLSRHLKTWECGIIKAMDISHIYGHVSAYHHSPEMVDDLIIQLHDALAEAKKTTKPQIVDQDGEMFFVVFQTGLISLCLRWKDFQFVPLDGDK